MCTCTLKIMRKLLSLWKLHQFGNSKNFLGRGETASDWQLASPLAKIKRPLFLFSCSCCVLCLGVPWIRQTCRSFASAAVVIPLCSSALGPVWIMGMNANDFRCQIQGEKQKACKETVLKLPPYPSSIATNRRFLSGVSTNNLQCKYICWHANHRALWVLINLVMCWWKPAKEPFWIWGSTQSFWDAACARWCVDLLGSHLLRFIYSDYFISLFKEAVSNVTATPFIAQLIKAASWMCARSHVSPSHSVCEHPLKMIYVSTHWTDLYFPPEVTELLKIKGTVRIRGDKVLIP